MSDSVIKGERKASARSVADAPSSSSAARSSRKQTGATARPAALAKRSAEKTPIRKAAKPVAAATKSKPSAKPAPPKQSTSAAKSAKSSVSTKSAAKTTGKTVVKQTTTKSAAKPARDAAKTAASKPAASKTSASGASKAQAASTSAKKPGTQASAPAATKSTAKPQATATTAAIASKARPAGSRTTPTPAAPSHADPMPLVRQPTRDEATALRAFEQAHKEFARGRFGEAAQQFRLIVERFPGVAEVTARARTYLNIAETRTKTEQSTPANADALYDRGVMELNRANYTAAQELFERALEQNEAAAHIHYGLAAVRARLGARESALRSLERALDLQPALRARASRDADLASLRNDSEFERVVTSHRS